MNQLEPSPVLLCANCRTPLQGEFCHECGQSIKSVIQPISHMLEDAGDIFFHMDERIVHTVPPLFTRPGYLTLEYFSGRRVRYVAPFRLMFVFCLLAFFLLHLAVGETRFGGADGKPAPADSTDAFAEAKTADAVKTLYEHQERELREAMDEPGLPDAARTGFEATRGLVREIANRRLAELKAPPIPASTAIDAPTGDGATRPDGSPGAPANREDHFDGPQAWASSPTQVHIGWLPQWVNHRLEVAIGHLKANIIPLGSRGPAQQEALHRIIEGFFSVLPQAMFVMVPLFALILKLFYVFRRRLYMEHLIVALHSHAFLFFSLLIGTALGFAKEAIQPHVDLAASAIGLVQVAIWVWIPVYLLLMQKRVYRQGWVMTILKYWLIGSVYCWLLFAVVGAALVIGMSH